MSEQLCVAGTGPDALRIWAEDLGVETFTASSGRVYPQGMKSAPLLRRWIVRLKSLGVSFFHRNQVDRIRRSSHRRLAIVFPDSGRNTDRRNPGDHPGHGWRLPAAPPSFPRGVPAHAHHSQGTLDEEMAHVATSTFTNPELDVFSFSSLVLTGIEPDVSRPMTLPLLGGGGAV